MKIRDKEAMEKIKPTLSVEFYRESNGNEPVRVGCSL